MFLHGPDLTREIKAILAEPDARCAVAFWGRGAEDWVTGANCKIIANLRMGGTNPHALQKINAELKQHDTLHAKVYIGSRKAVVASANASANGLGFEGVEQSGWIEAGYLLNDIQAVSTWFDDQWKVAGEVSRADWDAAKEAWAARRKPTLPSFANFDVGAPNLPFVTWVAPNESWTVNEDAVEAAAGIKGSVAERRVDDGLVIQHADDAELLKNKWVLVWRQTAAGAANKREKPWFSRMSDVLVRNGFTWDGERKPDDVLLAAENTPPLPFDPAESRFADALRVVLEQPRFADLKKGDEKGQAWYVPRAHLIAPFWRALREQYLSNAP